MKIAVYIVAALSLILTGCAGIRNIPFTSDVWRVHPISGYVENIDSTYSFTLCSDMNGCELPIIGNDTNALKYKGLKSYLNKICSHLEVVCDSILLYAPTKGLLFVEISENTPWKPRSQSANLSSEKPYTAWVRDDDVEDWNRQSDEIYTNVILDKRAKQLLIIDRLTYDEKDLAIIHIIQTETPKFRRMGLPSWSGTWADVTDPTCLEPISNWIEGHRKMALENYRRGQMRDAN